MSNTILNPGVIPNTSDAVATLIENAVPADLARIQASVSGGASGEAGPIVNEHGLSAVASAVTAMFATAGRQVKVFYYGDSVGTFLSDGLKNELATAATQTGYAGGQLAQEFVSGTTVNAARFDVSVTGGAYSIPAGGALLLSAGGGVRVIQQAAAWLVREPGAGTAKVEIVGNDKTTVLATLSASTDCSGALGFIRTTWAGSSVTGMLRITCLTGTITALTGAFARSDISGVQMFGQAAGGISPSQAGTVAMAAMMDQISWFAPDAVYYTARESAPLVDSDVGPRVLIPARAAAPLASLIVCGVWAVSGETDPTSTTAASYLENERLRYWARQCDGVFVDAWKLLPSYDLILRYDPSYDGVHISQAARNMLISVLHQAFGIGMQYGGRVPFNTQNASTRTFSLGVTGDPSITDALTVESPNAADAIFSFSRWATLKAKDGTTPLFQWTFKNGSGQVGITNNAVAAVADAGNYSVNGQWAISVDPTTGVAKIYGRVGGVLKSLTLGTLA